MGLAVVAEVAGVLMVDEYRKAEIRSAILKAADEEYRRRKRQIRVMRIAAAVAFAVGVWSLL